MHTTTRGRWNTLRVLLALLLLAAPAAAQVTVPNTLVSGAVIRASDLNTNFSTLGNHALDRLSGGNLSGSITADPGITIDGIDLSTALCSTCAASFQSLTINGVAIIAATGKIPALTSTYFTSLAFDAANLTGTAAAINGSNITTLTASNLAAGQVPSARLGGGTASALKFLRGDLTWAPVADTIAKSALYTALAGDYILATGTFTVTLPAASANVDAVIDVKNVSTGTITIARTGADTIDGATSQSLVTQYQSYTFISDGTNWWIR